VPTTEARDELIRRLVDGDPAVRAELAAAAPTSADPVLLVAAALAAAEPALLGRATAVAGAAHERRLVDIAAAYLAGTVDRARLLARDHLADHPDSLLATFVAHPPEKRNP
jgi:hypothetical protein